jgi:glycosyltransferase involved in cell wall biosynthesis
MGLKLSVCMIAKDEAKYIKGAIDSVQGLADEVIVVDTGSTDDTQEIAQTAGATVLSRSWAGSFAASRNESLEQATGDWILILDADERLDAESHGVIRELMAREPQAAYELKIRNYADKGNKETATEHYIVRLFPNNPALRFVGRIHEQIASHSEDFAIPRRWCQDATIWHLGYLPEIVAERGKSERNKALLEQSIADEPENPFHYFNLAQSLSVMGDNPKALEVVKKALELLGDQSAAWEITAWVQLLTLTLQLHGPDAFESVAHNAPEGCELSPDYWNVLAHYWTAKEEWYKAIACYEAAADFAWKGLKTNTRIDRSSLGWKPYFGIANIWLKLGQYETAYLYLTQSLRECPTNPLVKDQYRQLKQALEPILK